MSKPVLYVFSISHYCEKALWALEYLGIGYDVRHLAPGLHAKTAKSFNLKSSTLPVLQTDTETIQGSANIIDWADQHATNGKTLTPKNNEQQAREIEQRLDDTLGVNTRRFFYSEALVESAHLIRPIFTKDLPLITKIIVSLIWPVITKKMIAGMDLGFEQGEESKAIVDEELAWLEQLLADGRPYLAGPEFSRADIAAGALAARFADAKEHPQAEVIFLPPRAEKTQKHWHDRPTLQHIRQLYKAHRH